MTSQQAAESLARLIERGRHTSTQVIQNLMAEAQQRLDYRVPPKQLYMQYHLDYPPSIAFGDQVYTLTRWAEEQLLGSMRIPLRFVASLEADGERGISILNDLVNSLVYRIPSARLVRTVGQEAKAILSDGYKLIDQGELIAELVQAAQKHDLVFTNGHITDRRYSLDVLYPHIVEPLPGEYVAIAGQFRSSDYGYGAAELRLAILRVICTNLAVREVVFRKVHIGQNDWELEGEFQVSERTRRLASAAAVSAMADGVKLLTQPALRERIIQQYREAANKAVDLQQQTRNLMRRGVLSEAEVQQVTDMVLNERRIEVLPSTDLPNSLLRFQQALAWLANSKTGERKFALQEAAGG